MNKKVFFFVIYCLLITSSYPFSHISVVSSFDGEQVINSEGKNNPEGHIKTYVSGTCGKEYRLVTPTNAQVWKINITLVSEWSNQSIFVTVYEVIGEYPYNWDKQLDTPRASGLGSVSLIATLNVSKTYVFWARDAYAKGFTGYVEEIWNPYVLNGGFEKPIIYVPKWTIPDWEGGGSISVGSPPSYKGNAVRLYLYVGGEGGMGGSGISQVVDLDKEQLTLLFWLKPFPENHTINFQVHFDGYIIFNNTYIGSNDQYEWSNISIKLQPLLIYKLTSGSHEISFQVSSGVDYLFAINPMPSIAIDEVAILSTNESSQYLSIYKEYTKLVAEYENYRNTHIYTNQEFNSLNATYTQYSQTYHHSNDEYNSLLSENQILRTSQSLNYVLIIVAAILAATTIYFAKKKI